MTSDDIVPSETVDAGTQSPFTAEFSKYLLEVTDAVEWQNHSVQQPIEVDELASRVAKAYEHLRRVIDWKEEHIVRRNAIERNLKRTLLSEVTKLGIIPRVDPEALAEPLVTDLMRHGFFSSGSVGQPQLARVKNILQKYLIIFHTQEERLSQFDVKQKINIFTDIIELAACELEEALDPNFEIHAQINLMTEALFSRIEVRSKEELSKQDSFVMLYVAVQRALFSLDSPIIFFNLLKVKHPYWFNEDEESFQFVAEHFASIKSELDEVMADKRIGKYYRLCERYDAAYRLIGDVTQTQVKEGQAEQLEDRDKFLEVLREEYDKRYKTLKRRLSRAAFFSTASILLSGLASFLIFEGPVARLIGEEFSWFALFVDLMVPTALMFLFVIMIRLPSDKNFDRVKKEVIKIVFERNERDTYIIDFVRKKNPIIQFLFQGISLFTGAISLVGIWMIFNLAGVPWTSLYIDTVMVSMVIFAALIIRDRSREISIQESGSFAEFILDLFTLPLAKLGQWFSEKWREYNLFSLFFTVLVDTPFSNLMAALDSWRSYLKDVRSEIY